MDTPGLFGEWLKQRRKALDLTQEELSGRAGCSVFALRKIESGERRPSKQLAGLLATALEISEEEQPIFIRVARGDLNMERLSTPFSGTSPPSFSEFLTQRSTHETIPSQVEDSPLPNVDPKPASRRHLQIPPTPLLGRDAELAALQRLFKDPQCRLLTLTGMGGIGKTRLAVEFAACHRDSFPGGVHYVSLASINATESIVPAIADELECSFSGPADLKEQLFRYMSLKMANSALLVLDNLEHLIAQSSYMVALVSEFLQQLPQLKILATSRERLNIQGEWMYELHGLPVPPVELEDKLDEYSAAVLFLQRAQHIKLDFMLSDSERSDLIRICRLVEGTPLAIELAAAWVGILTCSEIANEIESNIDFLSTSMRDLPERHRSLRATFDHSWKLLSDHERDVLSRLSVFRGGFDRNVADKVAGATLPLLASLVSKSLVRRTTEGRYDLHEVIRQYALVHLEEDDARCLETCERHSNYYLTLVAAYENRLKSAAQQSAVREMTAELDNMRIAWDWGIRHEKFEMLGKTVRSFGWFFEVAGLLHDGIDQLELLVKALTNRSREHQMDRALGAALVHQGLLYFRRGQFVHAKELYEKSITILRSVGDKKLLADALIFDGTITHLNGDYPEAMTLLREGLGYAKAENDKWFAAYGVYNLGYVDSLMGDYEKGYQQMQDGLRLWRDIGDPHSISLGLNFLVTTQIELGKYDEARASMNESIALSEKTGNRWGKGTAYRYLGLTAMAEGQYDVAQGHFEKSLEIFGEYVEGWDIVISLLYLGHASLKSGDLAHAEKVYLDSLRLAKEAQSVPLMLDALAGIALVNMRSGKYDQAWTFSQIVLRHPATVQDVKDRAIQIKEEIENRIGSEQILMLKAEESKLSMEQVVNGLIATVK